jgi:hypothetical protein
MLATPLWLKLPVAKNRPERLIGAYMSAFNNGLPSARCPQAGCT